ncbi:hypothetical protein FRX31_015259 [Thalictrum thalictroides]|uniref:Uncharacterized protein n=1 Tax=Thalictrum thalictroides TaxID=46969 RepID=A0A7J6WDV0_THATH|nr:hypothetical protein FRX31_015259 [Thalictrum thalictroides]
MGKCLENEIMMECKIARSWVVLGSGGDVSLVLLSDTVFHEESFLCRYYYSSRFCHVLDKSVLLLFSDSLIKDADLKSTPDWVGLRF